MVVSASVPVTMSFTGKNAEDDDIYRVREVAKARILMS